MRAAIGAAAHLRALLVIATAGTTPLLLSEAERIAPGVLLLEDRHTYLRELLHRLVPARPVCDGVETDALPTLHDPDEPPILNLWHPAATLSLPPGRRRRYAASPSRGGPRLGPPGRPGTRQRKRRRDQRR